MNERFKLIDWGQDQKFIDDSQEELPSLTFDNIEDAEKWCNYLNQI